MKMDKIEHDQARVFAVLMARRPRWTSARVAAREAGVAIEIVEPALHKMVREGVARSERRGKTLVYKLPRQDTSVSFRLIAAAAELGLLPRPKMNPLPFSRSSGQG